MKLPLCPLLLIALPLLAACPSEEEEEPRPEEDGVIACGGTESLEGLSTGDEVRVSAEPGGAMLFEVSVGEADGHGLRLRAEAASGWRRVTEIWTAAGDRRLIPATARAGESLFLEVIVPIGESLTGSVELICDDVPEVCFDLADNDGDGAVDCADIACARDDRCSENQEDFQPIEPECSEDWVEVELDVLDRLSDQRTLYETRPAGEGAPWQSFWGGGEVVILPPLDAGSVSARANGSGMLCLGEVRGEVVVCREVRSVVDGEAISLQPGELPAWFEPDSSGWAAFDWRLDCVTE